MKFVLPRVILGNRGDLASRWGVLQALYSLGVQSVTVFRRDPGDVPDLPYRYLPYRPVKNLLQDMEGRRIIREANTVLWSVGLDMQDDSSLAKMAYLWFAFKMYRRMGLQIWVLFQGAGPLKTSTGRWLARKILEQVDIFIARDPGTYDLIGNIHPGVNRVLAHDAIFLPGFELYGIERLRSIPSSVLFPIAPRSQAFMGCFGKASGPKERPLIGLNVRQWFHFSSSILPYQFARKTYLKRSEGKMEAVIASTTYLVEMLRHRFDARIIMISAYQPGVVPWEDDLPWLERIKTRFPDDDEIILVDAPLSLPDYYSLMSGLDLMIGMRLHSSLIALRFGVPAINISYTLKGGDILRHLGLPGNVIDLNSYLASPQIAIERASAILENQSLEHELVIKAVQSAIETNMTVLRSLVENNHK